MQNLQVDKLRVVTRRDLPFGTQATQASHAAIDFQHQHPVEARTWNTKSNYLVLLTAKNEDELIKLITKATLTGIKYTIFREPDIYNEITAVSFDATEAARKLTSSCPLLGKEVQYV